MPRGSRSPVSSRRRRADATSRARRGRCSRPWPSLPPSSFFRRPEGPGAPRPRKRRRRRAVPLTFRRGFLTGARFAPDGQTIVYSAAWDGKPSEIFTTRVGSSESRPLGIFPAGILAISSSRRDGDLARLRESLGARASGRSPALRSPAAPRERFSKMSARPTGRPTARSSP